MNIDDDDIVVELIPNLKNKSNNNKPITLQNDAWLDDSPANEKIVLKEPVSTSALKKQKSKILQQEDSDLDKISGTQTPQFNPSKNNKTQNINGIINSQNSSQIFENTSQKTPSQTGSRKSSNIILPNIKKSTNNFTGNNLQQTYQAEQEDDMGQQQQVSGGFGDSQHLDEAMLKQMIQNQQKTKQLSDEKLKKNNNQWEEESICEDYIMESTIFDYDEIKQQQNFGIKKYSDAIYRGEIANGKRNGKGVMLYKKNRVYEGEWVNDVRSGRGYERYLNGNKYEGEFQNGKAHGKGVYSWANGEIFDGEWKNGVKDGYGIWKGIFGDSYIGEWKNSKADGYGVHQWKNGDRYEGEWLQCLKHGQGTDIFANSDSYSGSYKHGKPDGKGEYKWKNGSVYVGEFRDGLKHGRGKWKKLQNVQNCNSYDGQYENDKKNGYGVFTWESGNVYKGNYKDDERDGYGEMFWIDGSYYQGEWRRGIQHGQGKMNFPDGSIKEGRFENNVFLQPSNNQQSSNVSPIPTTKKLPINLGSNDNSQIFEDKNTASPTNNSVVSSVINGNAENKSITSRGSGFNIRAMSRGKATQMIRQITNGSQMSFQSNFQKAPDKLNPVKPPTKQSDLNNSNEYDYGYGGYSSPGQDSDSTRVSNILYSKMSIQKPQTNRENANNTSMQKPPRMALIMKDPQGGQTMNNSTNHGYHSNGEQHPSFLPEIKRIFSKSSQRTHLTQVSDQSAALSGAGGIRKASPEAIAIMVKNMQQNKQKIGAGSTSHWVPSGVQTKPEATNRIKKIVF